MEGLVIRETIDSELKENGTLVIKVTKLIHRPIESIVINTFIKENGELD